MNLSLSFFKRKMVVVFLALWWFAVPGMAEEVSSVFNDANRLYEQGKFPEAAAAYQKIISDGRTSTPLFFNLGNAWLKAGKTGQAIAAYRRAEKMTPRDPDVRTNLRFARSLANGGTPLPENRLSVILNRLTVNEWTVLTSLVVSLWFVILALQQWRKEGEKKFRGLLVGMGIVAVLFLILTASVLQRNSIPQAIVIVPEAVVRRGTFAESPSVFTLQDGAEIRIAGKKEDWLEVVDGSHRKGWLLQSQVQLLKNP